MCPEDTKPSVKLPYKPLCPEDPKPSVKPQEVKPNPPPGIETAIPVWDNELASIPSNPNEATTSAITNPLLTIAHGKNAKLKYRQDEVRASLSRVAVSIGRLKASEGDTVSNESKLSQQLKDLESDLKDVKGKIATEEDVVGELTADIELELNKQGEDLNDEVQTL